MMTIIDSDKRLKLLLMTTLLVMTFLFWWYYYEVMMMILLMIFWYWQKNYSFIIIDDSDDDDSIPIDDMYDDDDDWDIDDMKVLIVLPWRMTIDGQLIHSDNLLTLLTGNLMTFPTIHFEVTLLKFILLLLMIFIVIDCWYSCWYSDSIQYSDSDTATTIPDEWWWPWWYRHEIIGIWNDNVCDDQCCVWNTIQCVCDDAYSDRQSWCYSYWYWYGLMTFWLTSGINLMMVTCYWW